MRIMIKKFGTALISRNAGKEAYLGFRPILREIKKEEKVEIDFEGVAVMGPSCADEFLTPLFEKYGDQIKIINADNSSVKATLEFLEEIKK